MAFFLAFRNLSRNLRRTIAILLTLALGSGALFAFQGFINGVLIDFKADTVHSQYGDGLIETKGYRERSYKDPINYWITNSVDVIHFLKQQKGVEQVFPRVSFGAQLTHRGNSVNAEGQGINGPEEETFFNRLNIVSGKMLSHQSHGILLGQGLAKGLGVRIGDSVSLKLLGQNGHVGKGNFTVIGIFETGVVDFDNRFFRIQLKEAQKMLKTESIESIGIGLKEDREWQPIADAINKRYPHLEALSFAELDKVYYQNSVKWLNAQFNIVQIIIISIVILSVFNTISTSILERKQEIGNLRANGESVFDVMKLILYEGTLLGFFGSILGIALTYYILMNFVNNQYLMPPGPGSTRQFYLSFSFNWDMAFQTAVLNISAAIIASYIAGKRVAKMAISRALRSY